MIPIADLTNKNYVPGNYYAPRTYLRGELEMGLLENRRGDRLLALPDTFLEGLYAGLDREVGQASGLVLFNCGLWWGKHFFKRFQDEISDYYQLSLTDMKMADFLQALQNCWSTYGWGKLELDQSYQDKGFLVVITHNSFFANREPQASNLPVCFLEAGVLGSFFSELSGQELHCVQTSCESLGSDCNRFVIGLRSRLAPAEALVENKIDHESIMPKLCS
jgi:uncharacterized protein